MQLFVFFVISASMVGNVVKGDMALPSDDGDKQHSTAFLMMYKFMDDIFLDSTFLSNY